MKSNPLFNLLPSMIIVLSCLNYDIYGQGAGGHICLFNISGCDYTGEPEPPPEEDIFDFGTFSVSRQIDPSASNEDIANVFREALDSLLRGGTDCDNVRIVRRGTGSNSGAEVYVAEREGETFLYDYGYNVNPDSPNPGFIELPRRCGGRVVYDLVLEGDCDGDHLLSSGSIELEVIPLKDFSHPASIEISPCNGIDSTITAKFESWKSKFKFDALSQLLAFTGKIQKYKGRNLSWSVRILDYATNTQQDFSFSLISTDDGAMALSALHNKLDELFTPDRIQNGARFFVQLKKGLPSGSPDCTIPFIGGSHFDILPPLQRCPEDMTVYVSSAEKGVTVHWTIADTCSGQPISTPRSGSYFLIGEHVVDVNSFNLPGWSCSFKITVLDTVKPKIICPPDITLPCFYDQPPPKSFEGGLITDNSDSAFHFWTQDSISGQKLYREFTAIDTSLNSATCVQEITLAPAGAVDCPIHVKQGSTGDGSSWANAFGSLQDALDVAGEGDQIWVAQGIYKPEAAYNGISDRHKTFHIDDDIRLYGGFVGTELSLSQREWFENPTILSGQIGNQGIQEDNAYHVLYIDGGVTSEMLIDGFTIEDGFGLQDGAGSVDGQGAGIYMNSASPTIQHCNFNYNTSANGGAIFATNNSDVVIANCIFQRNGAVLAASAKGGAIYFHSNSDGKVYNSTFFLNDAEQYGDMIYVYSSNVEIWNSIFWDQENGQQEEIEKDASFGSYTFHNLLFDSPDFADGNYRLLPSSPALEGGSNNIPTAFLQSDFENKPRVINTNIDIGAFESTCTGSSQIFVDQNATGKRLGISWEHAFADLQDAIDQACDCPNADIPSIWVAGGTYYPRDKFGGTNERNKTFYIKKDVKIYGGFTGYSGNSETQLNQRDWQRNTTVLSGDLGNLFQFADNAYHVMYLDGTQDSMITRECRIDGFTISRGNADGGGVHNRGGGIYNHGDGEGNACSPTIANCRLLNNNAGTGGGLHNSGYLGESSPLIMNTYFKEIMQIKEVLFLIMRIVGYHYRNFSM